MSMVLAGVEHVGGNMHEEVPKGDAIFMKVQYVGVRTETSTSICPKLINFRAAFISF
jgi:hypothetical protein